MKKALFAFLLIGAVGCAKPQKPLIITGKGTPHEKGHCYFVWHDINGSRGEFADSCHLYHIGDTIR